MNMVTLPRSRAFAFLFVAALALALIAALQGQARLFAPSIPLFDWQVQPANVETSAQPVAPATVAPQVVPVAPASEASGRPNTNTTTAPVPADLPASTPVPTPIPPQQKVAPDGRPMGDFNLPPLGSNGWKGPVDY